MESNPKDQKDIPVFGTWNKWYAFLLVVLLIQVIIYTWLTYSYL
jgi:hypothetical protein